MGRKPPPIRPNHRLSTTIKGRGAGGTWDAWTVLLVGLLIMAAFVLVIVGGAVWVAAQ